MKCLVALAMFPPCVPAIGQRGQQPFAVQTLLHTHFRQQCFKLSGPALEEALHDVSALCDFAGLSHSDEHIPSESGILRSKHLLERHKLAEQMLAVVNALLQAEGLQLKAGPVVQGACARGVMPTKSGNCCPQEALGQRLGALPGQAVSHRRA